MKKLKIENSEKKIILEMHRNAIRKNFLKEEEDDTKITETPEELLNNQSMYFQSIGTDKLPSYYSSNNEIGGFWDNEVDQVVDWLDMEMTWNMTTSYNKEDLDKFSNWVNKGSFEEPNVRSSRSVNYGPLSNRWKLVDGIYYPAVEVLRVDYNKDEMNESLGSELLSAGRKDIYDLLKSCYEAWIDAVNNDATAKVRTTPSYRGGTI